MNVCDQCGEVFKTPKEIDFAYSTETRPDGTKTIETEPQFVSPCCKAGYEEFVDDAEIFGAYGIPDPCIDVYSLTGWQPLPKP